MSGSVRRVPSVVPRLVAAVFLALSVLAARPLPGEAFAISQSLFLVGIDQPAGGATLTNTVTLQAHTSAPASALTFVITPSGLAPIEVPATAVIDDPTSWFASWNSNTAPNGPAAVSANATRASDSVTSSAAPVAVTVSNAAAEPALAVTLTAPTGGTVSGATPLSATTNVTADSVTFSVNTPDGQSFIVSGNASNSGKTWTATWNTTEGPDGPASVFAAATKGGATAQSSTATVTVNNPLVVTLGSPSSGATVTGIVNLTATTSEQASGLVFEVRNVTGAIVASPTAESSGGGLSWSATWDTAGAANGAYTVKAVATQAQTNVSSGTAAVTVANVAQQTMTVAVTTPAGGATVSGTVALGATSSLAASSLTFTVTQNFGEHVAQDIPASGGPTAWTAAWAAGSLANGSYAIVARAVRDGVTTSSAATTVTLQNAAAPAFTAAITSPAPGTTVSGTVGLSATTSLAASSLTFVVRAAGAGAGSPPAASVVASAGAGNLVWTGSFDASGLAAGTYVVTASATREGNTVQSSPAGFTVAAPSQGGGEPVTVTVTTPASGATLAGQVTLSATANQAVDALRFVIDGASGSPIIVHAVGNATGTVWAKAVNTSTLPNAAHSLVAVATKGGQETSSAAVPFTVNNVATSVSIAKPAAAAVLSGAQEVLVATLPQAVSVGVRMVNTADASVSSDRVATYDAGRQVWVVSWKTVDFPNGQYRVEAKAKDAEGQVFSAVPVLVTLKNDEAAPATADFSVRMVAPAAGATLSGNVVFAASVNGEAAAVQFFVSSSAGGDVRKVDGRFDATRRLWIGTWDSRTLPDGEDTVGALATNAQNVKVEGEKVRFIVKNGASGTTEPAPAAFSVRLVRPQDGAATGIVRFAAAVEGTATEARVLIRLRGSSASPIVIRAHFDAAERLWVADWDASKAEEGTYEAVAVARNATGGEATSTNVVTQFVEHREPEPSAEPAPAPADVKPEAFVVHPSAGATVSGAVPLAAKTNFPAAKAAFAVRPADGGTPVFTGAAIFVATRAAWVTLWDTTKAGDGPYIIEVRVQDAAGTKTASASARVTVSNAVPRPVESVPAIPVEVVKQAIIEVPAGAVPLAVGSLPPRISEATENLNAECTANRIPAARCEAWLAVRHQAAECKRAGIITKEECVSYLKGLQGTIPGCEDESSAACAETVAKRTAGLLPSADLHRVSEAVTPHIGQVLRIRPAAATEEPSTTPPSAKEPPPEVVENLPFRVRRDIALRVHASPSFAKLDDETARQSLPAVLLLDADGDGIPDDAEARLRTDPHDADTDDDGYPDGEEIRNGYNPIGRGRLTDGVTLTPVDVAIVSGAPLEQPRVAGTVSPDLAVERVDSVDASGGHRLFGRARPGETVTIFVYSYLPVVLTTQAGEDGTWSYELEESLGDGEHEVYVTVTDETGKIASKSEPFPLFVEEARAVEPAEFFASEAAAAPAERPEEVSPVLAAQVAEPARMFLGWYVGGAVALVLIAIGIAVALFSKPRRPGPPAGR